MTTIEIRARHRGRDAAVGLGISLLVHLAVLAWLQDPHASRPDAVPEPRRMEFVLLTPPPAAPRRTVTVPPVQASAPAQRAARRPQAAPAAAPAAAPTVAPTVAPARRDASPVTSTPMVTSAAPAAPAGEATSTPAAPPAFDIAAARDAARRIAREPDQEAGTPARRKPLVNLGAERRAQAFERARRVDCQTARAGSVNLLANVVMLAKDIVDNAIDDSGCKW